MRAKANLVPSLVLLLFVASICPVHADMWPLPEKKKYYSSNKKYYLEVTPKKLENQLKYFQDKVAGRSNPGAPQGSKPTGPHASFYVSDGNGNYSKKTEFPLVNEVSPVRAIISNDGAYVVTFDNWHSAGYGEDVVVIYRTDGSVVKKFGLEDLLTKGDIRMMPRSISSIWWGGEHYIDEQNNLLVLKVAANRRSPREKEATFFELKIQLATGQPIEEKRDRIVG